MSYHRIPIMSETDALLDECKEEYLRHHPEMRAMKISYNKIVYEIARYYLQSP